MSVVFWQNISCTYIIHFHYINSFFKCFVNFVYYPLIDFRFQRILMIMNYYWMISVLVINNITTRLVCGNLTFTAQSPIQKNHRVCLRIYYDFNTIIIVITTFFWWKNTVHVTNNITTFTPYRESLVLMNRWLEIRHTVRASDDDYWWVIDIGIIDRFKQETVTLSSWAQMKGIIFRHVNVY